MGINLLVTRAVPYLVNVMESQAPKCCEWRKGVRCTFTNDANTILVLGTRVLHRISCLLVAVFLSSCSLTEPPKQYTPPPVSTRPEPPKPSAEQIADVQAKEKAAQGLIAPAQQLVNDCFAKYGTAHALADAAPGDILVAAEAACATHIDTFRKVVTNALERANDTWRIEHGGGNVFSPSEIRESTEKLGSQSVVQARSQAMDAIIKIRTPAPKK